MTLDDGDTAPGDFDITFALHGIAMQSMSDLETEETSSDGTTALDSFHRFPNNALATGWFYSNDADFLGNFFENPFEWSGGVPL